MLLQRDDLAALDSPIGEINGRPLMLPVDAIDEDVDQPRHDSDSNALQEFAETIRERGVRQPISVRPHPAAIGARRLRASKLAGLTEIPAFIGTTADSYDQVIENEQREGLRPLDLALFVKKRLALGDSQAEIARCLGKSRQWVTLATALIEAPDWLLDAYRDGRCTGMNELYEIRRLHGVHPQVIETWVAGQGAITRDRIGLLRNQLESTTVQPDEAPMASRVVSAQAARAGVSPDQRLQQPDSNHTALPLPPPKLSPGGHLRVHVEFDGHDYQLVVSVASPKPGHLYVRPLRGDPRRLAAASALKLLGFVAS